LGFSITHQTSNVKRRQLRFSNILNASQVILSLLPNVILNLLGMDHKIRAGRFLILNGISAVCWSVIVAGGGYFLGEVFQTLLNNIQWVQGGIMIALSLGGLLVWIHSRRRGKRKRIAPSLP
jgi:membrane protein DedA with SNARE-associated domain